MVNLCKISRIKLFFIVCLSLPAIYNLPYHHSPYWNIFSDCQIHKKRKQQHSWDSYSMIYRCHMIILCYFSFFLILFMYSTFGVSLGGCRSEFNEFLTTTATLALCTSSSVCEPLSLSLSFSHIWNVVVGAINFPFAPTVIN